MIGNNTISMNDATVCAALEFYLNERELREPHSVTKFEKKNDGYSYSYEVTIEPKPQPEMTHAIATA